MFFELELKLLQEDPENLFPQSETAEMAVSGAAAINQPQQLFLGEFGEFHDTKIEFRNPTDDDVT